MSEVVLSVRGLRKRFGGLQATDDVSFDLSRASVVGVIGPNGAGKTTLFNQLTGLIRPDAGSILLEGRPIVGLPPHAICRAGLVKTFQNVATFGDMTVLENATVGALVHHPLPIAREKAAIALRRVGLHEREDVLAGVLSLPEKARLELARALATEPRVILLDEVMATLTPGEQREMVVMVKELAAEGMAVLVIEHHMKTIMTLCERILVLNFGRLIAEGNPAEVSSDPDVIAAYLGARAAAELTHA
ncbi:MAG: ABC transporter ATP-binding protein [Burkholderiaceae bacterium]|jgi:branched-chain amino acid transport system ATP-binding protein|nr:ABC transporter ATP-binding protein [Burkholderiaceae bacterium]